jgi:hypothetical protein
VAKCFTVLVTTRRLSSLICWIAGPALLVILLLTFASGGKLLKGSGWALTTYIAAGMWIASYAFTVIFDIRRSRASHGSDSDKSRN